MKKSHDHTQLKRLSALGLVFTLIFSAVISFVAVGTVDAEDAATTHDMKTYGIVLFPDGIINGTKARASGGVQGEGLGYLYAMLMQHSNVKYVTWAEVQSGNAGCDVTIFWDCRWVTDAALQTVLDYMQTNSCLFYGEAPFRYDYELQSRTDGNGYPTAELLIEWSKLVGVKRYQSVDTREGANRVTVQQDLGVLASGSTHTYPISGSQWTNAYTVNTTIDGAVTLASFIVAGQVSDNAAIVGCDHGDVRHGVITGLVDSKPQNTPFIYEAARWVGDDTISYNVNLWPEGRLFGSFERFDDGLDLTTAQVLYDLDIPHVATINTNGLGDGTAAFILAHPDYPGLIGLHGDNHTYSFWGSDVVTAEQFAANILANMAYVNGEVPPDMWMWSTPGYNKGLNLAAGIELTDIEYAVGMNPLERYPFVTGYLPYDAGIIPYQFPFAASRSSAWYSLINYASFEGPPWGYYNLTGTNSMYEYANGVLFLDYHHVQDQSAEELEATLSAEWAWKKANRDLWCVRPDTLIDWYEDRLDLSISLSSSNGIDTVTMINSGTRALSGAGINIETAQPVRSITIDGRSTDNFRYSDGRLFVWADSIAAGESVEFTVEYGEPVDTYTLCRDPYTGALSPQIGSREYRIINDNSSTRLFTFTGLADTDYVLLDASGAIVTRNLTAVDGRLTLSVDPGEWVIATRIQAAMSPLYAAIPLVLVLGVIGGLFAMIGRVRY